MFRRCEMATIDVIIPCYGYGRFLEQCVDSVLTQDGPDLRVLILDDASPDETPEVSDLLIRKDRRVSCIRHPSNRGHIATYNEGLDWANADFTLLLSADDWILPGAFVRAITVMESDASVGFVHGGAIEHYEGEDLVDRASPGPPWVVQDSETFLGECRHCNPVATCTAVVRTSLQKRIGGYRAELPHSGDLEMWMRFAAHGSVGRVNVNQGVYRRHARNMSIEYGRSPLLDLRQREAAIDFFLQADGHRFADPGALRKMLRRGLAESAMYRAAGAPAHFSETMRFAASVDPAISHTLDWKKQHVKRWLGPAICSRISAIRRRGLDSSVGA